MLTADQTETLNLLVQGAISAPDADPDVAVDQGIELLSRVAETQPQFLIKSIQDVVEIKIDNMVMVALAILTAKAPQEFLNKRNHQIRIMNLLGVYGPEMLIDYVELLRSKEFGRGFGARPQKWVRDVMEEWRLPIIQGYLKKCPNEFCSLVRLVHPRYEGPRGQAVKQALNAEKSTIIC